MENILVRTNSSIGESNLQMQITPAYRQDIFVDQRVWDLTIIYLREAAKRITLAILAADYGKDHCHLFITNYKHLSIEYIARYLKGFTSYMMRKHHNELIKHKLWGRKFWSEGYFYRTVGQVTKEACRFYIEKSQSKHWTALDYEMYADKKQLSLTSFC